MRLRSMGRLGLWLAAGAAGLSGPFLIWSLLASTLHPTSLGEPPRAPVRITLADPVANVGAAESRNASDGADEPAQPAAAIPSMQQATVIPAAAPAQELKPVETSPPALPKLGPAPAPAADEEAPPAAESVDPVIVTPNAAARAAGDTRKRGLVILQIGDSHTSADFLSGELRRRLQARYGRGAPGYLPAGHPHIGVRSSTVNITASKGWSYRNLQKKESRPAEFWIAGYSAVASAAGETMSFSSQRTLNFETIEIEAIAQPGGGTIEVKLDGKVEASQSLASERIEPVVVRLLPGRGATEKMRELSIRITKAGTVNLGSVAIYNNRSGVTYNNVGYVGAQVSFLNKFDRKLFASDLQRMNPQIVVMSFGTNEASNESLDLAAYGRSYSRAIDRIKEALPNAVIVMVMPPDFNELGSSCKKEQAADAHCRRAPVDATASISSPSAPAPQCSWHTPAKLQQIRDVQRDVAKHYGLVYWNWASIMPRECGAHQWFTAHPALMSKDHVHFTITGYKKSAGEFLNTLIPIIEKVRVGANVIPNN